MLSSILNVIKTAASLLTNQPPSYVQDEQEKQRLSCINHLESKKFFIVSFAVLILLVFFATCTTILFWLPNKPELVTGFVTIYTKTSEILAIIISAYVGVQAAVDFKINSNSNASMQNNSQQTVSENVTVIHTNQKEEDYELASS